MTNADVEVAAWDEGRIRGAARFVVDRVRADVGPRAGLSAEEAVSARIDTVWAGNVASRPPEPVDVIAVVLDGRHEFPLGLEDGVEYACQLLAGQAQDDVIAEAGRPWPELSSANGSYLGVLVPGLVAGIAVWRLGDRPFCPVGLLNGAVVAAGVRITS
jgi:hypothetical protein